MDKIYADEHWNCRGPIPPGDVMTLKRELERDKVLFQPIVVRPYPMDWDKKPVVGKEFAVVAGFRRFKAVSALKWPEISAVILRGLTDLQYRAVNLKENVERKQLNIKQEADGISHFKRAGWTLEHTAKEMNQSKGWVQVRWQLLELEEDIQDVAAAGLLTQEQIKQIAGMPAGHLRYEAIKKIKEAKAKGERAEIDTVMRLGKKTNPLKRKPRGPSEIFPIIENIAENIGYGLATRVAAWCAGDVSDVEILREIKAETERQGGQYHPPETMLHIRL